MAMHNADCIISLGVRFNDRVTGNRAKFATGAKIVHIDIDGSELSKNISVFHGLRGDVKLTLSKLLPLINEVKRPEWQSRIDDLRRKEEIYLDNREGLTPRRAILTLNAHLGENTPVATDVGQHQMWSAQSLSFKKSRRFISSGGLGTMGFGLGAAIGAQIGGKDHATVLHACNTVNDLIETDRNFKQYVSDIEKLLKVEE
jgi:acetolactate synthase-1/2/3 large subunit